MTRRPAIVRQGQLALSELIELPEGTKVNVIVEPLEAPKRDKPGGSETTSSMDPLSDLDVWAAEGPTDLAAQHDHYASGAPRRAP